jgi:hypothetical protein
LSLEVVAHPTDVRAYTQSGLLHLGLSRYTDVLLEYRPTLSAPTLRLGSEGLQNLGDAVMTNVYVKGLGLQQDIAAQQTLTLVPGEEGASTKYEALLPLLPEGAALAQQGSDIHIALPMLLLVAEAP